MMIFHDGVGSRPRAERQATGQKESKSGQTVSSVCREATQK
jgi:hypothetical protein